MRKEDGGGAGTGPVKKDSHSFSLTKTYETGGITEGMPGCILLRLRNITKSFGSEVKKAQNFAFSVRLNYI
jgi:hypothetical protein